MNKLSNVEDEILERKRLDDEVERMKQLELKRKKDKLYENVKLQKDLEKQMVTQTRNN